MNAPRHDHPPRGERLYPRRSSRTWWHLTGLRRAYERVAATHLAGLRNAGGRLIDFGCGNCPYKPLLAPHVAEYVGCDLPGNPLSDRVLDQPDVLPFPDGWAHVVLSSQVLEHTVAPAQYLAECARVLRPGGLLVLSTHGVWRFHPDPLDLWRWTSMGLRRVVEHARLAVIDFRGVVGPVGAGLQIAQDAVLPKVPAPLRGGAVVFVQLLMQLADGFTPQAARDEDAGTYVLVARKECPHG